MGGSGRDPSRPGKYADIIAVEGDVLANLQALENVGFVMKGGVVYKGPAIPTQGGKDGVVRWANERRRILEIRKPGRCWHSRSLLPSRPERPVEAKDLLRIREVSDPQLSPEGRGWPIR